MNLNPQIMGNMGMYYTCYKLLCMGWNVMPTAYNARGMDIIVYNKSLNQRCLDSHATEALVAGKGLVDIDIKIR